MSQNEIILYRTHDGKTEIALRAIEGTVWLTQEEIAELFQKGRSTIAEHIQNILTEGELQEESVCRNLRRTAADGKEYGVLHYNLEMILAVGYRVRSQSGTQFRQWATTILKEYLVKGFVMNDERLKNPGGADYFDEMLKRIRDIRASEKRFYQKVRDLFALSTDYHNNVTVQDFFAEVQNKMLYAATGHTAAELIIMRVDAGKPNMNLTSFHGHRVRKEDVIVAKNYLQETEIEALNRIVTMFLDYAEDRVKQRQQLNLNDWRANVDRFLVFNERQVLQGKGSYSNDQMKAVAHKAYEVFDGQRRQAEAASADVEDLHALEHWEKSIAVNRDGKAKKQK